MPDKALALVAWVFWATLEIPAPIATVAAAATKLPIIAALCCLSASFFLLSSSAFCFAASVISLYNGLDSNPISVILASMLEILSNWFLNWPPAAKRGAAEKFKVSSAAGPPIAITALLFNTYSPFSSNAGYLSPEPLPEIYIPDCARMTPPVCIPKRFPNPDPLIILDTPVVINWVLKVSKNLAAIPIKASFKLSVSLTVALIASTIPSRNNIGVSLANLFNPVSASSLKASKPSLKPYIIEVDRCAFLNSSALILFVISSSFNLPLAISFWILFNFSRVLTLSVSNVGSANEDVFNWSIAWESVSLFVMSIDFIFLACSLKPRACIGRPCNSEAAADLVKLICCFSINDW